MLSRTSSTTRVGRPSALSLGQTRLPDRQSPDSSASHGRDHSLWSSPKRLPLLCARAPPVLQLGTIQWRPSPPLPELPPTPPPACTSAPMQAVFHIAKWSFKIRDAFMGPPYPPDPWPLPTVQLSLLSIPEAPCSILPAWTIALGFDPHYTLPSELSPVPH